MRLALNDLLPNRQYAVRVRAVGRGSQSEWSTRKTFTTVADSASPNAPTGVTWVAVSDAFHAEWNAVTTNIDGDTIPVTRYEVEVTASGTTKVDSVPPATGSSKVTYDLSFEANKSLFTTPRPSISFRVRSVDNKNLKSEWSPEVGIVATNPAPQPPTAPAVGAVAVGGTDSITLAWTAPADDDLIGYNVYTGSTAGFTPAPANRIYSGNSTRFAYTTLTYTTQYFKIRAVDKFWQESTDLTGSAAPTSPFVVDGNPPQIPTSLAGTITNSPDGKTSIANLTWALGTVPTDLGGFVVRFRKVGDTAYDQKQFEKEDRSGIVNLPLAYSNYEFQIRAFDFSFNNSAWSPTVTINSPANTAPANVTGLTSVATRDNITYSWNPVADQDLKSYEVTFSTSSTFASGNITFNTGTAATLAVGGLTPATTYYARVRAVDTSGLTSVAWTATHTKATLPQLTAGDVGAAYASVVDSALNSFGYRVTTVEGKVENTVKGYVTEYTVNSSESTAPTTGWSTTQPARTPGTFIWTRTVVTHTDNTTFTSAAALLTGNTGADGSTGAPGADGRGITGTVVTYQVHTNGTTAPTGTWLSSVPATTTGQFLWTRTVTSYTSGSPTTSYSVAAHGSTGAAGANGADGRGITGTVVNYQVGTSGTTAPTGTWLTTIPSTTTGQYLWTRTVTSYTSGSPTTAYSVSAHGATGAQGKGVSSITPFFMKVATSAGQPALPTTETPAGWTATEPGWSADTKLYRTDRIIFSDASFSYTAVTLVSSYAAAVQAMESANGKSKVNYSPAAPINGTSVGAVGDVWFVRTAGGNITAQYECTETNTWVERKLEHQTIASIDAGRISTGYLSADRIAANSLTIGKVGGLQGKFDGIDSRGADLVTNGTGSMQNNTNFSAWVGFSGDLPTGAARAFTHAAGVQVARNLDEFIPVNITRRYRLSYSAKQLGTTAGGFRSYLLPHDAFKLDIQPQHYMFEPGTLTTLAVELKKGDTTVTLTDSTNWYGKAGKPAGGSTHYRSIIWWDYVDPAGKTWASETYSRNWSGYDTWADGGITGNVITLKVPYDGPTRPVGTKLSNGSAGATYMYGDLAYIYPPSTWTNYSGDFEPKIVAPGQIAASGVNGWPVATAYVKVGFLLNYPPGPSNSQHAIANVSLSDTAAVQAMADATKSLTDGWRFTGTTEINGGSIRTDTVRAAQIKSDSIQTRHLTANSVSADKMLIGSTENMLEDPTFKILTVGAPWSATTGASIATEAGRQGNAYAIVNNATQQASYNLPFDKFPCEAGANYYVTAYIKNVGMNIPAYGFMMGIRYRNASGTFTFGTLNNATVINDGKWGKVSGIVNNAAPADTVSASFYFASNGTLNTGTLYIDSVSMFRAGQGELIVDGSITARQVTADLFAGKEFKVLTGGAIKSENYVLNTSGFRLDASGLEINGGKVRASTLIGDTLGSSTGKIQLGANSGIVTNGGFIRSNTYGGDVYNAAATAGFFINDGNVHIPAGNISANALKAGTISGTNEIILSGPNAKITGGSWSLSGTGLSIPNGGITAQNLTLQYGQNIMPPLYSDFEAIASAYNTSSLTVAQGGMLVGQNVTPKFSNYSLGAVWNTNTVNPILYLGSSTTDYNIPVEGGKTYIFSAYAWASGSVATNIQMKIKGSNGSIYTPTVESGQAVNTTLPAGGSPATAVRLTGYITMPAGVTGAVMMFESSTLTALSGFNLDGIQVEEKTSASNLPSSYKPSTYTRIDGGLIRTGEIRSVNNTTINGFSEPVWSIPLNGAATFTGMRVLGNTVLGNGPLDTASVIQSSNYFAGTDGWKITADGFAEFSEATVRGTIDGATIIGAGIKTNTGYDDIEITPGNSFTPAEIKFTSDGAGYDSATPASIRMSDSLTNISGTNWNTFAVQLAGGKFTTSGTKPRINITTMKHPVSGAIRADIDYHAGGDLGGSGQHNFAVDGSVVGSFDSGGITLQTGKSIGIGVSSAVANTNGISVTGRIKAQNRFETDTGYFDTNWVGGGSSGASINDAGRVVRTSSSIRYKQEIEPLSLAEAQKALDLEPVSFVWKPEMEMGDARVPGFIAEQALDAGMDYWVTRNKDGGIEGFRYAELTAAHNLLVKNMSERIATLEAQVSALTNNV